MRTFATLSSLAAALALATLASPAPAQPAARPAPERAAPAAPPETAKPADKSDCPPGAFCEEVTVAPPDEAAAAPPDGAPGEPEAESDQPTTIVLPPPPPGYDPYAPRTFTYQPDADGGPGQIIVYEPGAAPPHAPPGDLEAPPPPPEPKEKRTWRRHRQWGLNLRVDGVIMPRYRNDVEDGAGMAGLGLSLRYRPTPMFALDLSTDFLAGVDANGLERQELPFGLSAMLYVNPRNLVQFYLFGGIDWSFAQVFSSDYRPNLADGTSDYYSYFGGHAGLGLEFRVSKLIGINIDGLAFVRTRTDADRDGLYPEYYDARTGEMSNSSAAGMLRAGVTFWW
jgi:hypothetical protein